VWVKRGTFAGLYREKKKRGMKVKESEAERKRNILESKKGRRAKLRIQRRKGVDGEGAGNQRVGESIGEAKSSVFSAKEDRLGSVGDVDGVEFGSKGRHGLIIRVSGAGEDE